MKGFSVRIAKRLNRAYGRRGQVFSDRFHAHVLRTPREVRHAVRYVMENSRIHAARRGERWSLAVDPFAGGPCPKRFLAACRELVAEPRTFMLRRAWQLPWIRRSKHPTTAHPDTVLSLPPLPFVVREPVVGRYRLTTRAPDERLVLAA